MALDLASGLSIAGGLANTGYNIYGSEQNRKDQQKQNKLDRRQQEKMYKWQRDDARADWNTQNAYNDPSQQMERLRQAGLSPHLVYGKGADTTAMAVKSYNGDAPNQTAPERNQIQPNHAMQTAMQVALLQAQTDNVNADTILKGQEGHVKDATVASLLQNTSMSKIQQEQIERLKEAVLNQANANVNKTEADTKYTTDQNRRSEEMQAKNLLKITQEIQNLKFTGEKIGFERDQVELLNQISQSEIKIKKMVQLNMMYGIYPDTGNYVQAMKNLSRQNKAYWDQIYDINAESNYNTNNWKQQLKSKR